jgi:uncharacterized protein DUF3313
VKTFIAGIFLAGAAALSGCAGAPASDAPPAPDLSSYRAAVIGDVRIDPDAAQKLSETERQALERDFYEALAPLLWADTTSENDAGVLRVDITVHELDGSKAALNAVSTLLIHVPVDRGSIAFEARFYETANPEPVAKIDHRRKGAVYELIGGLSQFGHARNALKDWAKDLRRELEGA